MFKYRFSLLAVLAAAWLLWSGHYTGLLLSLGGLSCLIVLGLTSRMKIVDSEGAPLQLPLRFPAYFVWIVWEILKANVDVARRIVDPRLPIDPQLIRVRTSQQNDLGRVILANSITLTPGTVSVDLEGDDIIVHALTSESAAGVLSGEMDRRIRKLEGTH